MIWYIIVHVQLSYVNRKGHAKLSIVEGKIVEYCWFRWENRDVYFYNVKNVWPKRVILNIFITIVIKILHEDDKKNVILLLNNLCNLKTYEIHPKRNCTDLTKQCNTLLLDIDVLVTLAVCPDLFNFDALFD